MQEESCRHCGTSLIGQEIPLEHRREGGRTHYSRVIGVEVRGVYDGMLYYQCPDCGGRWHRFELGHFLRARAERFISE